MAAPSGGDDHRQHAVGYGYAFDEYDAYREPPRTQDNSSNNDDDSNNSNFNNYSNYSNSNNINSTNNNNENNSAFLIPGSLSADNAPFPSASPSSSTSTLVYHQAVDAYPGNPSQGHGHGQRLVQGQSDAQAQAQAQAELYGRGREPQRPDGWNDDAQSMSMSMSMSMSTQGHAGSHRWESTRPRVASTVRKRNQGTSSRGVASLTPEQLAKKRANDREAQRAIRERQKLRTEHYEREIRELKSQQPYLELQHALRQKSAVEAELAQVKLRLASIVALIEPILYAPPPRDDDPSPVGQTLLSGRPPLQLDTTLFPAAPAPAAPAPAPQLWPSQLSSMGSSSAVAAVTPAGHTASVVSPPSSTLMAMSQSQDSSVPGLMDQNEPVQSMHYGAEQPLGMQYLQPQAQTNPPSQDSRPRGPTQQRKVFIQGVDLGVDLDLIVDPAEKLNRIQSGLDSAHESVNYSMPKPDYWTSINPSAMPAALQGHTPLVASPPSIFSPTPSLDSTTTTATTTTTTTTTEPWATPCLNCPPTCPLDTMLLTFISTNRQRAADGFATQSFGESLMTMLNRSSHDTSAAAQHPLPKFGAHILGVIASLRGLPERVAIMYTWSTLTQWQLAPTRENYARIPPFYRPLPIQRAKSHPIWFDYFFFPRMRERLVREFDPSAAAAATAGDASFHVDATLIPFTGTISVGWPYEDADVLLHSPASCELMVNPVFERHLRRIENWSVGEAYARAFPALADTLNVKSEDGQVVRLVNTSATI
ncbi:hypothetical protein B0T22DRAFT_443623 [Podospora appendiculata]|uniref:BZIP domain-containing protein n=1 Tax=Podospora appendiculata TaxID=314037 RepID=A0AAE0X2L0_9PEZI|nr:hypothetical protein B0T22DRAFT_443623 [Podospora appendiculata]